MKEELLDHAPATPVAGSPADGPRPTDAAGDREPRVRSADARLARLHLRGGLLALARAELEQMAGAGTLDREALVDLAEVRWRSGDLEGALDAAEAHLASGGDEPMAHIVAAEALDRRGHLIDARGHSAPVVGRLGPGVDRMFAGEPRSSAWPPAIPGGMDGRATDPGRWGLLVGGREVSDPDRQTWPMLPSPEQAYPSDGPRRPRQTEATRHAIAVAATEAPATMSLLSPVGPGATTAELVDAGRAAGLELEVVERQIERGDVAGVADRLALLLRMDRALAPVILSLADRALGAAEEADPTLAPLQVLRGDAYRALGREVEATEAYQQAMRAMAARATTEEST